MGALFIYKVVDIGYIHVIMIMKLNKGEIKMNDKLKKELQRHINNEILDFIGHDVDVNDLDGIVNNIKNDIDERISQYIDSLEE